MNKINISIAFMSNYLNHHQIPLSNSLYRLTDGNYYFIQTEPMESERQDLGWSIDENEFPYLVKSYEKLEKVKEIIENVDVVIAGGAPEELVNIRLNTGKLLFRYSERVYKKGQWRALSPRGLYYMRKQHGKSTQKNMLMLCSSAYAPCDFNIYHLYPSRMFKWGYFPKIEKMTIAQLMEKKNNDKISIIWCGRFIDWKHPKMAVNLAKKLKSEFGTDSFEITMIGTGPLRRDIEEKCRRENLGDVLKVEGPMQPDQVRSRMLEADILLATSDYNEGWGAVINEGMGSGCCVVASHAMGSVPYLIRHEKNGVIYKSKSMRDLYANVRELFLDKRLIRQYGQAAYETVSSTWNAEVAAGNFVNIAKKILFEGKIEYETSGPCSKADIIRQRKMFHYLRK